VRVVFIYSVLLIIYYGGRLVALLSILTGSALVDYEALRTLEG
jgi:hypothetical protein